MSRRLSVPGHDLAHPADRMPLVLAALAAATVLVAASPRHLPAQTGDSGRGALTGQVLDAVTGEPVAHALIILEPLPAGLIMDGRGAAVAALRSIVTGVSGAYRFGDIVAGSYRLRVERIGYRGTAVDVDIRRPADASVSVVLEFEPVLLEPVRVAQRPASLFAAGSTGTADVHGARLAAERVRQQLFLAPDTRVLTYADITDGVTFGGGDVFRALQRFTGVSTRDDYSAELWTRGAPWAHTRVTFDGVPLFNPLHAVGLLSAVAPEVLGAVFFHPGVRPAALGEGAAGVVDLRSRPGGGSGAVRGIADISMASAKVALEQHVPGRGAWIASARRSYLDVLRGGVAWLGLDSLDLPFVFHDFAGRMDIELGGGARVEASGLWEQDRLEGDVANVLERTTASWGNTAGRVTLRAVLRGLEVSHSVGGSFYAVRTDPRVVRSREPDHAWTEPASRNEIRYAQFGGELSPAGHGTPARWTIGYDVVAQDVSYDGPMPRAYAVKPDTMIRLDYERSLYVVGVYADTRARVGGRITVNPGIRLEGGRGFADAEPFRLSPRLAARYTLTPDQTIAIAAGRSWQHMQALALAGPSIHPAFHAAHFWVWPDAETPALRADIISIGTERWLGDGWLAAATVFGRRTTGMMVPDPAPGRLHRRPLAVAGSNRASGVELHARRIGIRWSASAGYTRAASDVTAAGRRYPSSADRRDVFDATGTTRLPWGFRVAAAFTAMSGAPFTRAYSRSAADCQNFGFGCDNPTGSYVEEPGAERTPPYRSLDTSLEWVRRLGTVDVSAYVQLRNVFDRDNASTYAGSVPAGRIQTADGPRVLWEDRFERGVPRLPLVGLRLAF